MSELHSWLQSQESDDATAIAGTWLRLGGRGVRRLRKKKKEDFKTFGMWITR